MGEFPAMMSHAPEPELFGDGPHDVAADADALNAFLALTVWEVERQAERARVRPVGTTWIGLCNLMQRRGYVTVEELGHQAATSWASHLGVIAGQSARSRTEA